MDIYLLRSSTTPPVSLLSTGTVTTSVSSSSVGVAAAAPPLQPDPGLLTCDVSVARPDGVGHPRRSRMFDFFGNGGGGHKPPLSPIASSPEGSCTPAEGGSPGPSRPKHLQLPPLGGLFSKLVSSTSSLHKHNSSGTEKDFFPSKIKGFHSKDCNFPKLKKHKQL